MLHDSVAVPRNRNEVVNSWVSYVTISSSIVLHIVQTQHQTVAQDKTEPHKNISDAVFLLIREEHDNDSNTLEQH